MKTKKITIEISEIEMVAFSCVAREKNMSIEMMLKLYILEQIGKYLSINSTASR